MKKFLLSLLLLAGALLPTSAQQRTAAEAEAIAKVFMQNNGYDFKITKSPKINKIRTEKAGEITPYYIFNDTEKGGFVIVGGQEAMSDILAYSNDECFDTDDLPPAAQYWLDIYAQSAVKAADNPTEAMAQKRAAREFLTSNFSKRQNVAPLLGEINYGQSNPYYRYCPKLLKLKYDGTEYYGQSIVGCTAVAMGSIMRYWKWPKQAKGKKTHTFNYDYSSTETRQMTVEVNYDSTGTYDWDNMLPTYKSGVTYTDEQANAVALLLYHCGVSLQAGYGTSGTGAALRPESLVNYFGYANDWVSDAADKYDSPNVYKNTMADELSQGRPIWAAGSGTNAAHSYVCDGFDLNGFFHFNLGWNGSSNGYYEIAPTPTVPYGNGMYFFRHIHPSGKLTPSSPTRRVVIEAGLGDWNSKNSNIISAFNTLDKSGKYGETIICITTADEVSNAENHLKGLGKTQGIIFDRQEKITDVINTTTVGDKYFERIKVESPAQIDVDAIYSSDTTMLVTVYSQFPESHTGADYRIALVYTEDNVTINGIKYNYIARGTFPNNSGYENSIPADIEADKEYKLVREIPIPESILETNNTSIVALLLDGATGYILNANTVDLKQVNTWRENQVPSFFNDGKLLNSVSELTTYEYIDEKGYMPVPVRVNNPLFEQMPVEIDVEQLSGDENGKLMIDESEVIESQSYKLIANVVDSTKMIYLKIADEYKNSNATVQLTLKYKNNEIAKQTINFNFIKSITGINPYTVRIKGQLEDIMTQEAKDSVTTITLGGRISGKDIAFIKEGLSKLTTLDMSQANIVKGPGEYYGDYTSEDNIIGTRMFFGTNLETLILPETATEISNYGLYLSKRLSKVVLGNNVATIGNYAFSGCEALERITIPASVTSIGRQAFKNCPIVNVICQGETPADVGSKAFDSAILANATLVVPNEAAIATYKAAKIWKDFGNIISYDQYLTSIAPVTEKVAVAVQDGKIIVAEDAEVTIYTFAGKQVAAGGAGTYALPAGNYIVKVGNEAVKVRL